MTRTRVLIAGAAGRDFHNFNLVYRGREEYEVVAFTATQIPDIAGRVFPAELAGSLYPEGIPICPEDELEELIARHEVDEVVFAYSDVTHEHVMHIGSPPPRRAPPPPGSRPPRPCSPRPSLAWPCAPCAPARARARPPATSRRCCAS